MPTPFLRAKWSRLLLFNYHVEPELLKPFLPPETELDLWNGNCYISLVGFRFLHTRIKGIRIPWHSDFEEINLRFYVRRFDPALGWKRGVVFLREIVPKPAIAWVANALYCENYSARPTRYRWEEAEEQLQIEYAWREAGRWHSFGVQTETTPIDLKAGSEAEFITEHYWGYARRDGLRSVEYQVTHPRWRMHPVRRWHCHVDFETGYGAKFAALTGAEPASVFLAEGSEVAVMAGNS